MRAIIYTQRVEIVESYRERWDCADQRIADFIHACGFLPIPLPNRCELAEKMVRSVVPAGIILTGGNSLEKYGGDAPERDRMDRALIEIAVKRSMPLYGFCRGMQSVLDYFGNRLVDVEGHAAVHHIVYGETGQYEVNSYHNQGCRKLAKDCGLIMTAQAEDGVIESIRHKRLPIVATMWHPEREKAFTDRDMCRVRELFNGKGQYGQT